MIHQEESLYQKLLNFSQGRRFTVLFFLGLFFLIFTFTFSFNHDPDLGWHLRYGEEAAENRRISKADTFTHTFRNGAWVDYEWLSEGLFYLLYSNFSFLGLSIVMGLMSSFIFFTPAIFIKGELFIKFLIILWALIGTDPVLKIGARPQNISLILLSLVYVLLLKFVGSKRFAYALPIPFIFLIWANSHPAYYLGLFLIILFLIIELIYFFIKVKPEINPENSGKKSSRLSILLLIILFLSIYFTSFKPKTEITGGFSFDLVVSNLLPAVVASDTTSSGKVRVTISEWLPAVFIDVSGIVYLIGIVFSIALFTAVPLNKANKRYLLFLIAFIYISTLARRNAPFFFIIFLPFAVENLSRLFKESKISKYASMCNFAAFIIMLIAVFVNLPLKYGEIKDKGRTVSKYCETKKYPCAAIEFIKKTKPGGNMYNFYNWGGYLVWQLREYPTFIDGRFPWGGIFDKYQRVIEAKAGWEQILDEYEVGFMIVPRSNFLEEVIKSDNKWHETYSDDIAVVLTRNDLK